MLKELATIKDKSGIAGFLVYDGSRTYLLPTEEAKKEAAAGNIDTLYYLNGQFNFDGRFIPIIQGDIEKDIKKRGIGAIKRAEKMTASMSFDDYVNNDCIFRNCDLQLALNLSDIVLGAVCLVQEMRVFGNAVFSLTMAFYCPDKQMADMLISTLKSYKGIMSTRGMRNYDGFIMINLPLAANDFDLLTFQEATGLKFLYNLGMMDNMADRVRHVIDNEGFLSRMLMKWMTPTSGGIAGVTGVLREANRISLKQLGLL